MLYTYILYRCSLHQKFSLFLKSRRLDWSIQYRESVFIGLRHEACIIQAVNWWRWYSRERCTYAALIIHCDDWIVLASNICFVTVYFVLMRKLCLPMTTTSYYTVNPYRFNETSVEKIRKHSWFSFLFLWSLKIKFWEIEGELMT
jgi:hypothetical protein